MNDNELFELCKSVYEATGWECEGNQYLRKGHYFDNEGTECQPGEPYLVWFASKHDRDFPEEWLCPLYTSDYLLEKLPAIVDVEYVLEVFPVMLGTRWHVGYSDDDGFSRYSKVSDTPLKALLKLTLELHKKGLLDAEDN